MDPKYTELANRIGLGQSERIPKLFQMIADPAEAEVLFGFARKRSASRPKAWLPRERGGGHAEHVVH